MENNDCTINRSFIKEGSIEDRFYELVNERKKEIYEEYNGKVTIKLQSNEHEEDFEELNKDSSRKSQDNVHKSISECSLTC